MRIVQKSCENYFRFFLFVHRTKFSCAVSGNLKKKILEKKCQKNSCKSGKRVNLIQKPAPHENSGVEGTVQDVRDLKAELTFRATEQT